MRPIDRKQRLFGLSWASAFNHQPRSTRALASGLAVIRISISDTNDTAILLGLINVGAVYRMDTKAHHVPGFRRDCDGIREVILVRGQVRGAGTTSVGSDVGPCALFVGSIQESYFTVVRVGIIEVDQNVDIATVLVLIEGPILMHRKGMPRFRWFDVHR